MADVRAAGATGANLPVAPPGAARSQSVRAAQAAFFQAALQQTAAPVRSDAPVRPAPAVAAAAFDPAQPEPSCLLRPGSLVDLKV